MPCGAPTTQATGTYAFTVGLRDSAGARTTILHTLVVTAGGTSLLSAPDPRGHHTAVWTGSEMIVWGGAVLTP
jgi:hypothetical protein